MDILIAVIAVLVIGFPKAVWYVVGVRRANRTRAFEEHVALEPTYSEQASGRQPHQLGTAWARTTTFIK